MIIGKYEGVKAEEKKGLVEDAVILSSSAVICLESEHTVKKVLFSVLDSIYLGV